MLKTVNYYSLLALTLFAHHNAMPYGQASKIEADNCLINATSLEDCRNELQDAQVTAKVTLCLDNCAQCVRNWRAGVYDGRGCAIDCVQQIDSIEPPIDPECNLIKYFNSTFLAQLEEMTTTTTTTAGTHRIRTNETYFKSLGRVT